MVLGIVFPEGGSQCEADMIHRFRIQNFKSIIDVTVDLAPVTVLVGKSGTGKSNFVESIRALRDILSSGQQLDRLIEKWQSNQPSISPKEWQLTRPAINPQEWQMARPASNPNAKTSFEIEFSIAGISERFFYDLCVGDNGPRPPYFKFNEHLRLGDKVLFHQAEGQWVCEPEVLQVPQPGPLALGNIPSISEIVVAFTALTVGVGCYTFPDKVLAGVRPNQGFNGGGHQNQSSFGLDDQALNYLDALKDVGSNLQELHIRKSMVATLQRMNPSVSSVELDNIQEPTQVIVGHKFDKKILALQLAQESDGFRRFYAHLLALYQRPPKQTLLFEHPEDGIHPGALSLLADEFNAAPKEGRGQVILTTHSPELLDHYDADQIRVVELDGFATRIGPISTEQREAIQDDLVDAGELLTVDPARLDSAISEPDPA